eukprot:1369621-Pleurochrysis_carterae.AAC.1
MLPPCATAWGVSPAAVAAPQFRSGRPSVQPLSRCARKLLCKGDGGWGENLARLLARWRRHRAR